MRQLRLEEQYVQMDPWRTAALLIDSRRIAPHNSLSDTFIPMLMGIVDSGSNRGVVLEAGTGEGKTRVALELAISNYVKNMNNDYGTSSDQPTITIIAVPYVVIAEQFFSKIAPIRVSGRRPLRAKLLTSSNTQGNTLSLLWKAKAQEAYTWDNDTKSKYKYSVAKKEEAWPNDMWDTEQYDSTATKYYCDVIIGTTEMVRGLLEKCWSKGDIGVGSGKLRIALVIDEIQEIINEGKRTPTLLSLVYSAIRHEATTFTLMMSGQRDICRILNDVPLINDIVSTYYAYVHARFPKLVSTHAVVDEGTGWTVSVGDFIHRFLYEPKYSTADQSVDKQIRWMSVPMILNYFSVAMDGSGLMRDPACPYDREMMLDRLEDMLDWTGHYLPWALVAARTLIRGRGVDDVSMLVFINNKKAAADIAMMLLTLTSALAVLGYNDPLVMDNVGDADRHWVTDSADPFGERKEGDAPAMVFDIDDVKDDDGRNDSRNGKGNGNRLTYKDVERRKEKLRKELGLDKLYDVPNIDSGIVLTPLMRNISKHTRPTNDLYNRIRYIVAFTRVFELDRETHTRVTRYRKVVVDTVGMVQKLSIDVGMWFANADTQREDDVEKQIISTGISPSIIIATQKIAVGADFENIHYCAVLDDWRWKDFVKNSGKSPDPVMIDQVIGRADRHRVLRYVHTDSVLDEDSVRFDAIDQIKLLGFLAVTPRVPLEIVQRDLTNRLNSQPPSMKSVMMKLRVMHRWYHFEGNRRIYNKDGVDKTVDEEAYRKFIDDTAMCSRLSLSMDCCVMDSIGIADIVDDTQLFRECRTSCITADELSQIFTGEPSMDYFFPLGVMFDPATQKDTMMLTCSRMRAMSTSFTSTTRNMLAKERELEVQRREIAARADVLTTKVEGLDAGIADVVDELEGINDRLAVLEKIDDNDKDDDMRKEEMDKSMRMGKLSLTHTRLMKDRDVSSKELAALNDQIRQMDTDVNNYFRDKCKEREDVFSQRFVQYDYRLPMSNEKVGVSSIFRIPAPQGSIDTLIMYPLHNMLVNKNSSLSVSSDEPLSSTSSVIMPRVLSVTKDPIDSFMALTFLILASQSIPTNKSPEFSDIVKQIKRNGQLFKDDFTTFTNTLITVRDAFTHTGPSHIEKMKNTSTHRLIEVSDFSSLLCICNNYTRIVMKDYSSSSQQFVTRIVSTKSMDGDEADIQKEDARMSSSCYPVSDPDGRAYIDTCIHMSLDIVSVILTSSLGKLRSMFSVDLRGNTLPHIMKQVVSIISTLRVISTHHDLYDTIFPHIHRSPLMQCMLMLSGPCSFVDDIPLNGAYKDNSKFCKRVNDFRKQCHVLECSDKACRNHPFIIHPSFSTILDGTHTTPQSFQHLIDMTKIGYASIEFTPPTPTP